MVTNRINIWLIYGPLNKQEQHHVQQTAVIFDVNSSTGK